jgi:hypothetical protein
VGTDTFPLDGSTTASFAAFSAISISVKDFSEPRGTASVSGFRELPTPASDEISALWAVLVQGIGTVVSTVQTGHNGGSAT